MKFKILFILSLILVISCDGVIEPSVNDYNQTNETNTSLFRLSNVDDENTTEEIGCWDYRAKSCCVDFWNPICSQCEQCDCIYIPINGATDEYCEDFEDSPNCIEYCGSRECVENNRGLSTCVWYVECADPNCANYDTQCDEYPQHLGFCYSEGTCTDCTNQPDSLKTQLKF